MTAPSSRMHVNFLLHPDVSLPNPPPASTTTTTTTTTITNTTSSSWTDRSDLAPSSPHHSIAMMQLANAAALASRACAPVPVSPVSSSHSTSYSIDQQLFTPPPSPPPQPSSTPPKPSPQHHQQPQQQPQQQQQQQPTTSRSHRCNICSQTFSQKVRFLHHLFKVHNIRTYETRTILPCSKCDAAFLRNTDRSKHDLCVHQRLRPFRCDAINCNSSFFFAKDLTKHRSTVHLRHKPFVCSICPKAFGKREHMTSHVKRVHQKLRPFKCDVCDIRLASKYNLQGHLKTAAHAAAETLANTHPNRSQYIRRS